MFIACHREAGTLLCHRDTPVNVTDRHPHLRRAGHSPWVLRKRQETDYKR